MDNPELSVVMFAFNEEANIRPVLTELRQWLAAHEPRAEIVFVDDGSSDGTSAEAAKALDGARHQLLRHPTNRGIGAALKTGVRVAKGDWVTFLPADGQIAPDAIGALRSTARTDGAEVVFSVYDHRDDGFHRKEPAHENVRHQNEADMVERLEAPVHLLGVAPQSSAGLAGTVDLSRWCMAAKP